MSARSKERHTRVAVEVSADRMEAWITVSTEGGDQPPNAEDVQAGAEDVTVASEELQAGSEDVTAASEEVQAGAEHVTAASEEVEAGFEDIKTAFEEVAGALEKVRAVPEDVKAALEKDGIVINDFVVARIEAFEASMEQDAEQPERFLIAKGLPPVECKDGEFTWHESLERFPPDWQGDARIDFYAFNSVVTVEENQPIGTITRATPGVDGFDVYGNTLKTERTPREVQLDKSVRLAEDGSLTVFSNIPGRVVYTDQTLVIEEVLTIDGDVDFESGSVDSTVNVEVRGTVHDLFTVRSEKSIKIGGAIEAANVEAKGDVVVFGGILGRAKGTVEAEGEIAARFCDEADLRAEGDIKIYAEVINSRVRSESKLFVGQGSVIGGEVYAREGIEAATLGSEANVPTPITVGIHAEVLGQAAAIDAELRRKRETGERIHRAVKPLLVDLKRLTPTQKKQATELLSKIRALVTEIQKAQVRRDEILQAGRAGGVPHVLASFMVRQGVSVRIGRRQTVFKEDMKGPVKIEKQKVDGVTEFVAVNSLSGSLSVLPSSQVVEGEPCAVSQTAHKSKSPKVKKSKSQNGQVRAS
ncbi:MAG: FapA family protein [Planctomycetota bacterium]|jgi:uncharacterized protein (DUF342 family)